MSGTTKESHERVRLDIPERRIHDAARRVSAPALGPHPIARSSGRRRRLLPGGVHERAGFGPGDVADELFDDCNYRWDSVGADLESVW